MNTPTEQLYDALLVWASRAFTAVNPAFVFVATLAFILVGLQVSHFGWSTKQRRYTATGLLLTGCAAAWSIIGLIVVRSGGGGVNPREIAFLSFFFSVSGILSLGSLGMQALQHRELRRGLTPGDAIAIHRLKEGRLAIAPWESSRSGARS